MSLITGIVDAHHEMELSPSVQLVRSTWFARHLWTIVSFVLIGLAGAIWAVSVL